MMRRAAMLVIILAQTLGGLVQPAPSRAAPSASPLLADIWVRLFPTSSNQVKAALYVHTALQAHCAASISGANGKGPGVTPQAGNAVTDDEGIAFFRYFYPKNATPGRRWASATCTSGASRVAVQSSFYLPYNARANAEPPSQPLKVQVPRITIAFGSPAPITVRSLPRALCTGLLEGETSSGIFRAPMEPRLVGAAGNVTWSVRPQFTGDGSIAVTCDLHKTFVRAQASITVQ